MNFCVNLSTAKNEMTTIFLKIEELRQSHAYLEKFAETIPEGEFDEMMTKVQINQNILNNLLIKYENIELKTKLKKKIDNRAKKRNQIISAYREKCKRRKELHQTINESILSVTKEFSKDLEKENKSKQIKNSLSKINRKIYSAKRRIMGMEFLCKSSNEEQVENNIENSLKLWEKKLNMYNEKEKYLRKMLTLNSETLEDQWRKSLFGDKKRDRKIIKRKDLCKFFEIRQIWDSYIMPTASPYGSSITPGWVFPPENPSELWGKYLLKENSILK